jgi:peptidoglycan lytic transglycosylase
MKAGEDRHERQDHPRRGRTAGRRSRWRVRAAALALLCATATFGAAPARAATGGLSAAADSAVPAGEGGKGIAFSAMRLAGATWYGPGLYGNRTACGQTLRPGTIGVAHRNLPCGTAVKFAHHGHSLITRVIDRGPFTGGTAWDLTNGARRALGFEGSGKIHYAVELRSSGGG